MSKIILHLDMNSYFASVEQQANPILRGRPVGVCEHLGGIIIAPSVEAKRIGIKLGTPVWEALKICPNIVLLPTDPDKYRHVTRQWMKILQDYSDEVEQYSIDEAFVDINAPSPLSPPTRGGELKNKEFPPTGGEGKGGGIWNNALMLGLEIKQRLRQEVGQWLSCSIGIGPNKLVAKIAADLDGGMMSVIATPHLMRGKQSHGIATLPLVARDDNHLLDRICVVRPQDIPELYQKLKLTDIPGIGERMKMALNKLGIFSLKDLRDYPFENLLNQFGIWGWELHRLAHFSPPHEEGLGEVIEDTATMTPLTSPLMRGEREGSSPSRRGETSVKSIGHMYTLPRPIRGTKEIKGLMMKLAEKVGRRMRKAGARGNVIHYFDTAFGKQKKLGEYINEGREIYREAWGIYKNFPSPGEGRVRERLPVEQISDLSPSLSPRLERGIKIMGLSISGLVFNHSEEPLFERYKKPGLAVSAMDKINNKYGEFTIIRGRLLGIPDDWGKDTVGFGRTR